MISSTKRVTLLLTSTAHGINDGNNILMIIIYAFLFSSFGFSNFLLGLFGGIFWAISALASPVVSYLADRGNSIRVMGFGILLWVFGLDIFGLSIGYFHANLVLVFLSVIICGFSSAFYHPIGGTAVSQTYGGNAGTALGINGSMGSVGRAFYPALSSILLIILGQSNLGMGFSIIFISFIAFLNAVPSLLAKPIIVSENQPSKPITDSNIPVKQSIAFVIIILTLITIIRSIFTQGVTQFIPILLLKDFGYNLHDIGIYLTIILIPAIFGQPIFGILSDKFDRRVLFAISNFGSALSFFLFLEFPSIIWLIFFGFFTYSLFPLMLSLIGDLVPKNNSNMSSGIIWGIGAAGGGALGPFLVGTLSSFTNLTASLMVVTILGFFSGILVVFIPKSEKRSKTKLFN